MNTEYNELKTLEESLWKTTTRFDREYMNKILADDFFEFGRSGKIYTRQEIIDAPHQEIKATLPLKGFKVTAIDENVKLVTYISQVMGEHLQVGNRSSLWLKTANGWKLCFHQGTPA